MTDKLKDAAEMALEAIDEGWLFEDIDKKVAPALRQALAEWTPDDTDTGIDRGAWSDVEDATKWVDELRGDEPRGDEPKREWQWLTEEDIHDLFMSNETVDDFGDFETIACAVSTQLKGKNNG